MSEASTDYIKYCTGNDLSIFSEYIILYPFSGTEYNEYGIFKVSEKQNAKKGIDVIKTYLSFKKSNWDTRYMGEEYTKICNAKITSKGDYILYTILSDEESKSVEKLFGKLLTK